MTQRSFETREDYSEAGNLLTSCHEAQLAVFAGAVVLTDEYEYPLLEGGTRKVKRWNRVQAKEPKP